MSPSAVTLLNAGRFAEAEGVLQAALKREPESAELWMQLALAVQNLGRTEEAENHYRQALARESSQPMIWFHFGLLLRRLGRPAEARDAMDRCAALAPGQPEILQQRGEINYDLGAFDAALADFDALLRLKSDQPQILLFKGVILAQMQRHTEALAALDRAIAFAPRAGEMHYNRAVLLEKLGRTEEALLTYERCLGLSANAVDAWNNRGAILRNQGRLPEAVESFSRAIALAPQHIFALTNRATALWLLGRHDDAAADFRLLLQLDPQDPHAQGGLLAAACSLCDWDALETLKPRLKANNGALVPPLQMVFAFDDPRLLHDSAAHFLKEQLAMTAQPRPALPPRGEKIRIAYLSADFQAHATAWLMTDLIERHDRARFEVIGISWGPDDGSAARARLARAFDRFIDTSKKSDPDVAQLLRQLPVDIAIDLKGHTQSSRPGIFARRPAPLQVSWLGFPGTTASDFHDYVLADRIVLPHDQQPFWSEKIVHLPDCYQANDPSRPLAAVTRSQAGLPDEAFVFATFNQHRKITRDFFDIWMRLLAAVPGSVLWLLDDSAREPLRRHAQARGIDPARLIFAPHLDLESHLARVACADLMLDALPCGAHTTTSDALWMGVPMVTCLGKSFAGRVAASLLTADGCPDLITESPDAYEKLALELARDGEKLKGLRARIAVNRQTAPLFDGDRFRRHIEQAYVTMMDIARAGEEPRAFDVPAIEA